MSLNSLSPLLSIVLSVLPFTASDYSFGIVKHFVELVSIYGWWPFKSSITIDGLQITRCKSNYHTITDTKTPYIIIQNDFCFQRPTPLFRLSVWCQPVGEGVYLIQFWVYQLLGLCQWFVCRYSINNTPLPHDYCVIGSGVIHHTFFFIGIGVMHP